MKKILQIISIISFSFILAACSSNRSDFKTTPITDEDTLILLDTLVKDAISDYFDIDVVLEGDVNFAAFETALPSSDNSQSYIPHSTIFQAESSTDPVDNRLQGYGGVISSDHSAISGLILNIYSEEAINTSLTEDDLINIATTFLTTSNLVSQDEELTFHAVNLDASSDTVKVLNFSSDTKIFAVGINLQLEQVVYFEYAELPN